MTESFITPTDENQQQVQQSFQQGDSQGGQGEGNQDTHSPEYQNQVMQKRINDKDEFIKQLQSENQQTREMYASLEERMQNLSKIEEVLNKKGQEQQVVDNQDTNLDEDALVGKVIENLNKAETKQKMDQNYNTVVARLESEFGSQYVEEKVSEAAKANGLSIDDMRETARKSPDAFYTLVGLKSQGTQRPTTPAPTRGSQQAPQETGVKDAAYFANLMRTNPREYWKAETQREFRKLFAHNQNN